MGQTLSEMSMSVPADTLRRLHDNLEHERTARTQETLQRNKLKECAAMQFVKSIETPACYHDCEKALLANEYQNALQRCVRNSAAELSLNRVIDPMDSSVERQILARQIQTHTLECPQLLNLPEAGYHPAVFSQGFPHLAAEAEAGSYGSHRARANERLVGAFALNNNAQNKSSFNQDVVNSQIKQSYSFARTEPSKLSRFGRR